MTLKFYPTGLSGPDLQDQAVRSGEWQIGRIWQYHDGSGDLPWRWSLFAPITGPRSITRLGRAATFDQAKSQFAETWSKLLSWAALKELSDQETETIAGELMMRASVYPFDYQCEFLPKCR